LKKYHFFKAWDDRDKLYSLILDAGLLQFGWFDTESEKGVPFKLHLDMLPAYPDILKAAIDGVKSFTFDMSRIVCMADSVPFGVALSLETGIPLVYSRGSESDAVHDLVGAYDIGHPAILAANSWTDSQTTHKFIHNARKVGLDIQRAVALLEIRRLRVGGLTEFRMLTLSEVVDQLEKQNRLPAGQAAAVRQWLQKGDTTL
jgi:hypothetical protein